MFAPARLAAIALAVVAVATPARAETHHIAVLVGDPAGSDPHQARRWAEDDVQQVADVLVELGRVSPGALYVVKGGDAARVKDAILAATGAVGAARRGADDAVIVTFYYAGHFDGAAIELGADRMPLAELKALLAATGADVRALILDAGGTTSSVDLTDELATTGEITLAAHGPESAELRGSIFTHRLVSGLRGAADANGDGRVTLAEVHAFTAGTAVAEHAPVVLTDVAARATMIELPAGFDRAQVIATPRDRIVADVPHGTPRRIAVPRGRYTIKLWRGGALVTTTIDLADGETASARWDELPPAAAAPAAPPPAVLGPVDPNYAEHMLGYSRAGRSYRAFLGTGQHEIDLDDFYHRVGRDDLADAYNNRRVLKGALTWGGIAVIGTGIVYGAYKACFFENPPLSSPRWDDCIDDNITAMTSVFAGAFVGGLLTIGGVVIGNHPASDDEMRELTERYNTGLRTHAQVTPYVTPGGAGAMLTGTF
jgi:hypothetical protein